MTLDPDKFWSELDATGEDRVRKNLASDQVYGSYRKGLAAEWLRTKDRERDEKLNRELIDATRSAADAARDAAASARDSAREARFANRIAIAATIAAIASIAVAIVSLFLTT